MLGTLNVKEDLRSGLQKHKDIAGLDLLEGIDFPQISGLLIDWVTNQDQNFSKQAAIIEHYVKKGIPTVIFDRYFGITQQEYLWLNKFNVSFLEPAVNNRIGFDFFPQWTTPLEENWDEKIVEDPPILLGFQSQLRNKVASFEKYYITYSEIFPDKNIVVRNLDAVKEEWMNSNIKFDDVDFKDVAFSLLIGSKKDYMKGILPLDIFEIMKKGCLCLLPHEHRFFSSMFQPITIDDERDLDYWIMNSKIRLVMIEEIFDNLRKRYPEFTIKFAIEKLLTLL